MINCRLWFTDYVGTVHFATNTFFLPRRKSAFGRNGNKARRTQEHRIELWLACCYYPAFIRFIYFYLYTFFSALRSENDAPQYTVDWANPKDASILSHLINGRDMIWLKIVKWSIYSVCVTIIIIIAANARVCVCGLRIVDDVMKMNELWAFGWSWVVSQVRMREKYRVQYRTRCLCTQNRWPTSSLRARYSFRVRSHLRRVTCFDNINEMQSIIIVQYIAMRRALACVCAVVIHELLNGKHLLASNFHHLANDWFVSIGSCGHKLFIDCIEWPKLTLRTDCVRNRNPSNIHRMETTFSITQVNRSQKNCSNTTRYMYASNYHFLFQSIVQHSTTKSIRFVSDNAGDNDSNSSPSSSSSSNT